MTKCRGFLLALVVAGGSCARTQAVSDHSEHQGKAVVSRDISERAKIEKIPAMTVLSLPVVGSYEQHPKALAKLLAYANKKYAPGGNAIGIYPMDPDSIGAPHRGNHSAEAAKLRWEVALPLERSAKPRRFSKPAAPFTIKRLPEVTAATVITTVKDSHVDGLRMKVWVLENGYVQVAPTRMEFLSSGGSPEQLETRIIMPIRERRSGIVLR